METKTLGFTVACKQYFGYGPGGMAGFAAELKALTYQDKLDLAPMLADVLSNENVRVSVEVKAES